MLTSHYRGEGETLVVVVESDRLDCSVAHDIKQEVVGLLDGGSEPVVVDLSKVEFIDSSGLGAIVALLKYAGRGRPFELAGLNRTVFKVFQLTRMTSVFEMRDRAPAAA